MCALSAAEEARGVRAPLPSPPMHQNLYSLPLETGPGQGLGWEGGDDPLQS